MFYKYRKLYTQEDEKFKFNEHTMLLLKEKKIYVPSYKELNDPWEKIIKIPAYKSYTENEKKELLLVEI